MLLNNAARDPQSQAGANVCLGGEKWLEDVFLMLWFNPAAGVENGDANSVKMRAVPCIRMRDAQDERSAVGHGINGIGDRGLKMPAGFRRTAP